VAAPTAPLRRVGIVPSLVCISPSSLRRRAYSAQNSRRTRQRRSPLPRCVLQRHGSTRGAFRDAHLRIRVRQRKHLGGPSNAVCVRSGGTCAQVLWRGASTLPNATRRNRQARRARMGVQHHGHLQSTRGAVRRSDPVGPARVLPCDARLATSERARGRRALPRPRWPVRPAARGGVYSVVTVERELARSCCRDGHAPRGIHRLRSSPACVMSGPRQRAPPARLGT